MYVCVHMYIYMYVRLRERRESRKEMAAQDIDAVARA